MNDTVLFPYFILWNAPDAKRVAREARTRMPPFNIFEGGITLSRQYLYQWGARTPEKNKWGGGGKAHRGTDYFVIVVFCFECGVSEKMFKLVSLPPEIHFKSL